MDNGNLYLTVILLMDVKSVDILHSPNFFGASTIGIAHRLKLSLINPLSNHSYTYPFISTFYVSIILCNALFSRFDSWIKSIFCDILLVGENLVGMLLTNMSWNSLNTYSNSIGTTYVSWFTLISFGMTAKQHPCFSSSFKNSLVEHITTLFC